MNMPEGARRTRCIECGYTYGTHAATCSKARAHLHGCYSVGAESEGFGAAIEECRERDDGTLWAGNGEYGTRVNYCPFCGYSARVRLAHTQYKPE